MFKRFGLPMIALFGLLALAPFQQAKAAVRFGVYVGAPAYTYPAYQPCPIVPVPAPAYVYRPPVVPAPAYVYPYGGWAGRDFHGRVDRSREFHVRGRR